MVHLSGTVRAQLTRILRIFDLYVDKSASKTEARPSKLDSRDEVLWTKKDVNTSSTS